MKEIQQFTNTQGVLLNGIGAAVYQTTAQSVADSTNVQVLFDTVLYDTDGCFDNTHANLLQSHTPGWYRIEYAAAFAAHTDTGDRYASLLYNGTQEFYDLIYLNAQTGVSGGAVMRGWGMLFLNANDYIQLQVEQTSGTTINTRVDSPGKSCFLKMRWESS